MRAMSLPSMPQCQSLKKNAWQPLVAYHAMLTRWRNGCIIATTPAHCKRSPKKVSLSTRWKLQHRGPLCRQSLTQLDKPCWPCHTPAQQPVIYPTVISMARVCILLLLPLRPPARWSPPTLRCGMLAHAAFSLTVETSATTMVSD